MAAAIGLSVVSAGVAQAAPGDLDTSFGQGGMATIDLHHNAFGNALVVLADGRIVVAGTAISTFGTTTDVVAARFTQQGAPDSAFGGQGTGAAQADFQQNEAGYGAALQPDGKVLVAGDSTDAQGHTGLMVTRFNADGSLDTTFGSSGEALPSFAGLSTFQLFGRAVALQPDGQIVVAGYGVDTGHDYVPVITRIKNPAGTPDNSFDGSGQLVLGVLQNTLSAVALTPNGTIEAAGEHSASIGAPGDFYTESVTGGAPTHGALDLGGDDVASAIAIQPDGKILIAGYTTANGTLDFAVVRLNSDHSVDTTFGTAGKAIIDLGGTDAAKAVVVQPDSKIVVAGTTTSGSSSQIGVVRLLPNGKPDPAFGHNGISLVAFGAAKLQGNALGLDANGDIVVGGVVTPAGSSQKNLLVVRLHGDAVGNTGGGSGSGSGSSGGGGSGVPAALTLSGVSASTAAFRQGSLLPMLNPTGRTKGTLISVSVSAAAQLTLTFSQSAPGRLAGGHCAAPSRSNRRGRHCTRHLTRGSISFQAKAGANTISFAGRLAQTKKLRPGTYTVTITATAAGTSSAPATLRLTVKR